MGYWKLISREHSYREELKVKLDLCSKNHYVEKIIEKVPPVKKRYAILFRVNLD